MAQRKPKKYGAGTVFEYSPGKFRWQAHVPVNPDEPDGPKKRVGNGRFKTAVEAQEALNEALRAVKNHQPATPSSKLMSELALEYLNQKHWENSTKASNEKIVRVHIIPKLGHLPVGKVTSETIKSFYEDCSSSGRRDNKNMNGPLSANSVNKIHIVLGAIMQSAVDLKIISVNPTKDKRIVRAPAGKQIRAESKELETWSVSELQDFLKWSEYVDKDDLVLLWKVFAWTGVRRSEGIALRWADIDFKGATLQIRRAADPALSKALKKTKTGKSRSLVLSRELTEELQHWRELRASLGPEFVKPDSFVFGTYKNELRGPNDVSARWARAVKRAQVAVPGLRWVTIKGLRHTHATLLMHSDVNPKVVQERLGHSDIAITLNTYSHATPTIQRESMEKFDRWVEDV
jgi:integrase